jgi:uncharacterized protein (DUF1778 family)
MHYDALRLLSTELVKIFMATSTKRQRKEYPLSMRLPQGDIAVIDRAAEIRGRSRTDFVRDAAVRAAEEVLLEDTLLRMTPSGFRAFMAAIARPATAVPEFVEVLKRAAPWDEAPARR